MRLYQSYLAAGSARKVACQSHPTRAAAPSPDHLRDQQAVPPTGQQSLAGGHEPAAADVAYRRRRTAAGTDGAPGDRGKSFGERGCETAFGAFEKGSRTGLQRIMARTFQQQNEWRDAPALAPVCESRAVEPDYGNHWR